jgi:hypothetical protein
MVIRVRYRPIAQHVHCRVFIASAPHLTFTKVGDLIVDERDWPAVRQLLGSACEWVEEDRDGLVVAGKVSA